MQKIWLGTCSPPLPANTVYIYIFIDRAAFGNSFADDRKGVPTLGFFQTFFQQQYNKHVRLSQHVVFMQLLTCAAESYRKLIVNTNCPPDLSADVCSTAIQWQLLPLNTLKLAIFRTSWTILILNLSCPYFSILKAWSSYICMYYLSLAIGSFLGKKDHKGAKL